MQGITSNLPVFDQEESTRLTMPSNPESNKLQQTAEQLNEEMDLSKARETFSSIIGMMVKKSTDLTDKIDRSFD